MKNKSSTFVKGRARGKTIFPSLYLLFSVFGIVILQSCGTDPQAPPPPPLQEISYPAFSADTAYALIEKQLSFGPRVPNTQGHVDCAKWMQDKLTAYGAKVQVQEAVLRAYDGTQLNSKNIIASFNPDKVRRIMLSAHWDTRPVADQDSVRRDEPIPGANDAGSGVAVLMELARLMQQQTPQVGVDLFFWDSEDYGNPNVDNSYGLGAQHWARNKHNPAYLPMYGINLDMVGAKDAYFSREGLSMKYAPKIVEKVWQTARRLGHDTYFKTHRSAPLTDDHRYVNEIAKIQMIDIIDQPNGQGFFKHWHTHQDDIQAISKETLHAVGETMADVVYREK
ncbi:MAG: M28 family peptidase [Bacteroidota bacterium]